MPDLSCPSAGIQTHLDQTRGAGTIADCFGNASTDGSTTCVASEPIDCAERHCARSLDEADFRTGRSQRVTNVPGPLSPWYRGIRFSAMGVKSVHAFGHAVHEAMPVVVVPVVKGRAALAPVWGSFLRWAHEGLGS